MKKAKIITVDSCEHCPFEKHIEVYDYSPEITCTHIKTEHKDIEDVKKIPDWCPLEDKDKKVMAEGRNFLDACKDVFKNDVIYRRENSDAYMKKDVDWIAFYMNHQIMKNSSVNRTDIESLWYNVRLTRKQIREW